MSPYSVSLPHINSSPHPPTTISPTMLILLTTLLSSALLAEANIDGLVCSNTSYYDPVEYVKPNSSCCETKMAEPECTTTTEEACANVTQSICKVSSFILSCCL